MNIIYMTPNESGAYPPIQSWNRNTPPNGYAVVPLAVDTAPFYECGGFVALTVENGVVTGMAGDTAAYNAWKEAHPEPEPEPEPDDLTARVEALEQTAATKDDVNAVWDQMAAAYQEGVSEA